MSNYKDWSALKELSTEFLSNIKNVYVFDKHAIFIVTYDDIVYGFGLNKHGCVGAVHCDQVTEPIIIYELCDKRVIKFAFAFGNYVCNTLALTKTGRVYSWGQLTYRLRSNYFTPEEILFYDEVVIDICCSGEGYCLALTANGSVYTWGRNTWGYLGIGKCSEYEFMYPINIQAFNGVKIIAIDCGTYHSLALTDDGVVFGWGEHKAGQLGCGNSSQLYGAYLLRMYTHTPIKISIADNITIIKIRCGHSHSLVLSTGGDIYAFGSNNFGQIGDGSNEKKILVPVKIEMPAKCVDIAAFGNSNISIAKLDDGYCYVWGECVDKSYSLPKKTRFENINEIVIHYCSTKYSYDNITNSTNHSVIRDRFINSFNNSLYSDIAFKIDDKLIYAQKPYLISVCNHFETMFTENSTWSESLCKEIPITQYSYSVYYSFLKYLYTGLVDITTDDAFELFDLANSYLEDELKHKCAQIIKEEISIENVCEFYLRANEYDLTELKECCVSFAAKNIKLVKQTEGFKQTNDSEFLKELMLRDST